MEISGTQTPSRLHHEILSKDPSEIRKEVKQQQRCSNCITKFKPKGIQKFLGNQQRRFMKLNTVIGLHSAARALSRETFPYHKQVQERPRRTLYHETVVSNRFDDINEFALCQNCYRDNVRKFSGHSTFNHTNSSKFLYLQRHVVNAGPEIQFGRNQSNAVRARIQSEDRRNQDMHNIMNDLIEPGPSARPSLQIDPASLIIPPYRPPAPPSSPSTSSQPSSRSPQATPQLSQQSTLPTQPRSPSIQHQSSSPSQHSSSPQQSSSSLQPQQQEQRAGKRQTRAANIPTAQEGSIDNDTDGSDEEDYFIPIGQGDPDYDDSETDSDNSDDSENQNDLFASFQSDEFQTCTAYWVPPNGFKGQLMQLVISTSMAMDRCVICAREKIEQSRLMLTLTNLWDLVEFGGLSLLGTVDQRFVCTDQCIGDHFKVTDYGRQKLEEKGRFFRLYSIKQESSTF